MPIEFKCECGRDLYLRDELAGKQILCPECRRTLTVPFAIRPVVLEEAPPEPGRAPGYDALGERSEEPKPVRLEPRPLPPRAPGQAGGVNASKVIGGLAMMIAGGVMLAVGGMGCNHLRYILLIIGFITFIRGLAGSRDDD
jgi:hypothetical protein